MAKTKTNRWFIVGLLGVLIAAPNATMIRYTVGETSPYLFNALRFLLCTVATAPFFIKDIPRINRQNITHAFVAGISMTVAVISFVWAIKLSQASYVSIITLLTPIVFILYSVKMTGEKISAQAMAGVTLAAAGAVVIVVLPIAVRQNASFVFFPIATVLTLLNTVSFPYAIINFKKANDAGLSMPSLMGISSAIVFVVNALLLLSSGGLPATYSSRLVFGVLYSGIAVALISRIFSVVSYEHVGSVVTSALAYLETLLAIIFPVLLLHEKLSVELVFGGLLILAGVYIAQHAKPNHHRTYHIFRHH